MTHCNLTKTGVIALLFCLGVRADGPLIQAVDQVVGLCNTSRWCAVVNVDDTGFDKEICNNSLFSLSVSVLSNSWQSITNEWPAIRDDFGRRVIFRSMIGFAGTNAFLGIMGQIVQDGATNAVSRKVVIDSALAPRTPLWMFVADNYAALPVSNLLIRIIGIYPEGDPFKTHFQSILSGEYKQWLDDARASGAIEY